MGQVSVGPAAKKRVAQLKKYITTLGFKQGKWVFKYKHAKHAKDGRELQVGFLAKKRLATLKNKVVDVTYESSKQKLVTAVRKIVPESKCSLMVKQLEKSLAYAGRMYYVEYGTVHGVTRATLFFRKVGDYFGAGADCSQFAASHLNWFGVPNMSQYDATGSLLAKGRQVTSLKPGDLVFFGPGSAKHVAIAWKKVAGVWWLIEFGEQSAPDSISLPVAMAWFKERGYPGVRYRRYF